MPSWITHHGTENADTIFGSPNYINQFYAYGGNDTLVGTANHDQMHGGEGADLLKGAGGYDQLFGDNGDDTLKGGGGADYLHGGAGYDTVSYTESQTRVFVSLHDNIGAYGDAEGDTFVFIENITGSQYNDDLWGHNGPNVLNGMLGNDSLKGFGGNDTLRGEAGDDFLDGGSGADTMIGGTGNDTYFVDNYYDDVVTEYSGEGADIVRTSTSYQLTLGADVETLETTDPNGTAPLVLYGNSSGNNIFGNNGANIIWGGGGGADQMTGRGGNDTYYVSQASDRVIENGGQGNDTVLSDVSWTLTAGSDVETLQALGMTAINLTGNANGNVVRGNDGNNTLNGGDGRDDLIGLGGQDQFLFDTALNAATNVDRILDFNVADDTILLDQTIFSSSLGLGNIAAGEFVIGAAALDANDRIIYNSGTGALSYDSDGNGGTAQIQFAALSTGLALTNLDFLVVA
jgi:Ca2+-binding RTX toxin-like protein